MPANIWSYLLISEKLKAKRQVFSVRLGQKITLAKKKERNNRKSKEKEKRRTEEKKLWLHN